MTKTCFIFKDTADYEWNYSKFGPDFWPHLEVDQSCGGVRQSPINIDISQTIYKPMKPLNFFNYGVLATYNLTQTKTGGVVVYLDFKK